MTQKRVKRTITRNADVENITLEQAFTDFIREKRINNLSHYSIVAYENSYKKLKTFINDNILAKEVDSTTIEDWILSMLDDDVKPITLNYYLRSVRTFIYWCQEKNYIETYKIKLAKEQETAPKTFSDDELSRLLERPRDKDSFVEYRTWTIVNWVLGTGNRSSTILNVKIEDIDFVRKDIILTTTKNKKVQVIPLSNSLATIIREYILTWLNKSKPDDYLFPNVGNEQLSRNGLRLSFSRYCKDRGVEKTSIHGLRHTFCKLSILHGIDPFRLQKMLQHSNLQMTQKYSNIFSDDLKTDFEKFNPLDNLNKGKSRKQVIQRS